MFDRIQRYIYSHLDYRTDRRQIVIFESDDWGAIRMPSPHILSEVISHGYEADKNIYESLDHLEREEDLLHLSSVLEGFIDKNGHHPAFTLNYVMTNPIFEKALEGVFETEPFISTYKHQYKADYPLNIVNNSEVFKPQYHCFCHFNIYKWMEALKKDIRGMRWLCEKGCVGTHLSKEQGNPFVKHYDAATQEELILLDSYLSKGLKLFQEIFGFESITAIASNYLWPKSLNKTFLRNGVKYLQGSRFQLEAEINNSKHIPHWIGQKESSGIVFGVRNCIFEPVYHGDNAVNRCFIDIANAFRHHKPAIVCSHRLNYMGYLDPDNRTKNLRLLKQLLDKMLTAFPDIEFMTSDQFAGMIMQRP